MCIFIFLYKVIPEINAWSKKKSELAAFKVFEIKCYLINEDQIYRQQGICLNKTCACICIMQMKTEAVSRDPGKDPHQILPVHLGPELQQILPL